MKDVGLEVCRTVRSVDFARVVGEVVDDAGRAADRGVCA